MPTSDNLTWDNYEKVDKSKKPPHIALTGWFDGYKAKQPASSDTTVPKNGMWMSTTSKEYTDVKFTAKFIATGSWVVKGKESVALLKHEQLHLRIAEYLAGKANANMPVFKSGDVTAMDADKVKARAAAKTAADAALLKQMVEGVIP